MGSRSHGSRVIKTYVTQTTAHLRDFSSQPDRDADAKKAQLRRLFDKQSKPVWLGAPFDVV